MARYNSSVPVATTTGTATIATPLSGTLTKLTGTAPYTVTLPAPALYSGQSFMFWNNTSGVVTLSTPTGNIRGPGITTTITTYAMPTNTVYMVASDGIDYILTENVGGSLTATSGAFSGTLTANAAVDFNPANASISIAPTGSGTLTINPATAGNINNMNIGATTRGTGAFTSLAANGVFSLTATSGTHSISSTNSSSGTGSGALTIAGGLGVAGTVYAGGFNGPLTGSVTGNVTSSGTSSFSGTLSSTSTTTITGTFTYGGSTVLTAATSPYLGTNSIIRTNVQAISESITIPAGTAGMTAGPVTINNGYTITVNGDWSIV